MSSEQPSSVHPGHNRTKQLFCLGRITPHRFVRLEERPGTTGKLAMFPVYVCTETGLERAYGYLKPHLSHDDLEDLFGPLRSRDRFSVEPLEGPRSELRRVLAPSPALVEAAMAQEAA